MKKLKVLIGSLFILCMLFSSLGVNTGVATAATNASDPITAGKYFIRNAFSDKYVCHATPVDHQTIKQREFENIETMKWEVKSAGNGYYTIENYITGLHITAGNDQDNTDDVVGNEYDGSDEQLWQITKVGVDMYAVTSASGGYLSLNATSSNYTNENIGLSNSGNYGTWYFHSANPKYSINATIDQSYAQRYGSANARSRANKALAEMTKFYMENFGVYISTSYINTVGSSYADACGGTYSTKCTHTTDSGCQNSYCSQNSTQPVLKQYHHTNINNVLYRLPVPSSTKRANLMFCGRQLCVAGAHSPDSRYWGVTDPDLRIIVIDDFESVAHELVAVMHEVGHLFGAIDHYGASADYYNGIYGVSDFDDDCIYGCNSLEKDGNVIENHPICEACKRIIRAGLNN